MVKKSTAKRPKSSQKESINSEEPISQSRTVKSQQEDQPMIDEIVSEKEKKGDLIMEAREQIGNTENKVTVNKEIKGDVKQDDDTATSNIAITEEVAKIEEVDVIQPELVETKLKVSPEKEVSEPTTDIKREEVVFEREVPDDVIKVEESSVPDLEKVTEASNKDVEEVDVNKQIHTAKPSSNARVDSQSSSILEEEQKQDAVIHDVKEATLETKVEVKEDESKPMEQTQDDIIHDVKETRLESKVEVKKDEVKPKKKKKKVKLHIDDNETLDVKETPKSNDISHTNDSKTTTTLSFDQSNIEQESKLQKNSSTDLASVSGQQVLFIYNARYTLE